jgi:flagellar biosynthesis anti-sigma factor FlgM
MSNTISPFGACSLPETVSTPVSAQSGADPAKQAAPEAAPTESVTLSAAALASTQVLASARSASGVDAASVAAIKAQIASGSYNVAPEDLAQAIATVLKETN